MTHDGVWLKEKSCIKSVMVSVETNKRNDKKTSYTLENYSTKPHLTY